MSIRTLVLCLALLIQQLSSPFETPWYRKITRVVAMPDGHHLTVPAGFTVNLFADKLQYARFMALAPNGDVFLAEPSRDAARITVLRDADQDGVAELRETFATGLARPFGLAFWKSYLYVGNNDSVVRFSYTPGQTTADGVAEKIADLPPSDAALDQDTANRLHIDMTGYSVVRIRFRDGQPAGPPVDFLSGFIARDDEEKEVWGRPVGLLSLPDGSMLVSDDGGNRVWRVSYEKK
jgi:glucose/arabinose dehydrogenase